MSAALYSWPTTAKFGRMVPKSKFYEHAAIAASVREKFVAEIQRITWAYKLADGTIHLRGDDSVPEIQIFTIDAKADDVSDDVLKAIDKAIPFPIIFELNRESNRQMETRMVAAHKQLGGVAQRISDYFTIDWLPSDSPRVRLPTALDLAGLYAGLLAPILPISPRAGEAMSEATERIEIARKLEREIAILELKLRNEPQFNRKVEYRRELRDRFASLKALTDPATPKIKDASWTS